MIFVQNGKIIGVLEEGVFKKSGVNESRHLLWSQGGVPALDADLIDTYGISISQIVVSTDKGRIFSISKDDFLKWKKEINYGFGRQYFVPKEFWKIENAPVQKKAARLL